MSRAVYISIICLVIFSCQTKEIIPKEKIALPFRLINKMPKDTFEVGANINFDFNFSSTDSLYIIWSSTFGDVILEGKSTNTEKISFKVPQPLTTKSGDVDLYLYKNQEKIDHFELHLKPSEAVGELFSTIGPKALLIDQERESMLSIIPRDKFYNPQPDGTAVEVYYKYPNLAQEKIKVSTKDFIASKVFNSKRTKGKLFVGSKSQKAYSNEELVEITPGSASNFQITLSEHFPFADGRQSFTIYSNEIKDEYNNRVADGTQIIFRMKHIDGKVSIYKSKVIAGVSSLEILNPVEPGLYEVQAGIYGGVKSNILQIGFRSIQNELLLSLNELNELKIGPVRGELNQLIPDGTIGIIEAANKRFDLEFVNGLAIFKLPVDLMINNDDVWKIKILGISKFFSPKSLFHE